MGSWNPKHPSVIQKRKEYSEIGVLDIKKIFENSPK
jgi:hypothetical protein